MYLKEQMKLLLRLTAAVVISIPIFIIGIVYMSLVKEDNPGRHFFEERLWAGQVSRGEWFLFVLATPIMFYCASVSGYSSPHDCAYCPPGIPPEIASGTLVHVETGKSSLVHNSILPLW
jgi:hypothetical protein